MNEHRLEHAARELCRLRGIDPERQMQHGAEPGLDGFIPAICLYSPAWRLAAREIVSALHLRAALAAYDSGGMQVHDDQATP